jgi:predicted MFS family arabinose efflux permease
MVGMRAQTRWPPERVVLVGLTLTGAVMVLWPLAWSLPVMLVAVAAAGMADGPALAATFATRQRHVPRELYGQVFTTAAGLKVGAFSIGSALSGPAVSALGSAETLVVAAGVQLVAAATGLALMRLRLPGRAAAVR